MARTRLPELYDPQRRLGRHVNHDPQSLRYLVPAGAPQTVQWDARIPVLDQGDLGSCTGNATVGALGTGPLYEALPADLRASLGEPEAIRIYSDATALDPFPGTYPPTDTGSDGLSAAKAAQRAGYLSGYTHATSLPACYAAIVAGPFITGINWMSGMDNPDAQGRVHATGYVRGGHEVCVVGYDAAKGLWRLRNSWGDSWGRDGYFYLPDEDYSALLREQGDATLLVPVTAPAPTPTPPEPPAPTPVDPLDDLPTDVLDDWAATPHGWHKATVAAKAYRQWRDPR